MVYSQLGIKETTLKKRKNPISSHNVNENNLLHMKCVVISDQKNLFMNNQALHRKYCQCYVFLDAETISIVLSAIIILAGHIITEELPITE